MSAIQASRISPILERPKKMPFWIALRIREY
jgi:hypothetical protein